MVGVNEGMGMVDTACPSFSFCFTSASRRPTCPVESEEREENGVQSVSAFESITPKAVSNSCKEFCRSLQAFSSREPFQVKLLCLMYRLSHKFWRGRSGPSRPSCSWMTHYLMTATRSILVRSEFGRQVAVVRASPDAADPEGT